MDYEVLIRAVGKEQRFGDSFFLDLLDDVERFAWINATPEQRENARKGLVVSYPFLVPAVEKVTIVRGRRVFPQ